MKKILSCIALTTLLISSCKKDTPDPIPETPAFNGTNNSGVLVANQGNFTSSNSSLTYVSPENYVYDDIYYSVNQTTPGDILQSIFYHNSKLYLVVNNSGKIEVCNSNLNKIKTISGLTSPRYILNVGNNKAYVSDYSGNMNILNLVTDSITGSVNVSGWTEDMVLMNGKVYVNSNASDKIYVIDPATDLLSDSIPAAPYGNYLTADANGKLWLLCTGNFSTIPAQLLRINPVNGQIEFTHQFALSEYPALLKKNHAGTEIYFINTDLMKMNATDSVYPAQSFLAANGRTLYGLGIDPQDNIYVSDAMNFIQKGKVYKYSVTGDLLRQFSAGIAPGDFCFFE